MKCIRTSVFETNSSSTHSICISKENIINFPTAIHFGFGEYGWENDTVYETADYLYTGIVQNNMTECIDKIKEILDRHNIAYTFAKIKKNDWYANGCIDHAGELYDFINDICSDEDKLLRYLFGDNVIYTGNDNSNEDTDMCYCAEETIYNYETNEYYSNPNHNTEKYEYYFKGN